MAGITLYDGMPGVTGKNPLRKVIPFLPYPAGGEIKAGKYRGLSKEEKLMWKLFCHRYPGYLTDCAYNILVGYGVDPGHKMEIKLRQMAVKLTRKRIDVVALKGEDLWIVEIKRRCGLSAIGQLFGYQVLFRQTYGYEKQIQLLGVTGFKNRDEENVYLEAGIFLKEVGFEK